jgi:hypothetical protein
MESELDTIAGVRHDGSPYGQFMAIGGVAYIAAVVVLRRRS